MRENSLRRRLIFFFSIFFTLVTLAVLIGISFSHFANRSLKDSQATSIQMERNYELRLKWLTLISDIDYALHTKQNYLISIRLASSKAVFIESLNRYIEEESSRLSDTSIGYIEDFEALKPSLINEIDLIFSLMEEGEWVEAQLRRHTELNFLQRTFNSKLTLLTLNLEEERSKIVEQGSKLQGIIRFVSLSIFILAIMAAIVSLINVMRKVLEPINRLVYLAELVSTGDFKQRATSYGTVEMDTLGFTLNQMLERIENQISDLNDSIASQKEAELKLTEARKFILDIIDSMPSVIIGVNSEGIITLWNKEAENMFSLTPQNVIGKQFSEVIPRLSKELDIVKKAIKSNTKLIQNKKSYFDGDEQHFEDIIVYPLLNSSEKGAVIRIDNITNRIRIEEMMIQSEKMLSVGGLAAGMAHEINNPLGGMMQTASVLNERLTDPSLEANIRAAKKVGVEFNDIISYVNARKIGDMVSRINDSGRRAAEIVSNMLSFSKSGGDPTSLYSMSEIIDRCIRLSEIDYNLKKNYDFRKIHIEKEYEDHIPDVPCDRGKIQQVLMNIFRNGSEAMCCKNRESDTSNADMRFMIRLAYEENHDMLRVEIEDNGPGMDEELKKRIFEPFFTTKPTDKGTGLGLSVSYFIITENHNGEMYVESAPGFGAKFVIKLPCKRSPV